MCTDHDIATWVDGDVLVIEIVGQLTLTALSCFRAALARADGEAVTIVIIDGSDLEFMDAAGLSALIGSYRRLDERGIVVRLTNATGAVRRLLELLAFDRFVGLRQPEGASAMRADASSSRSRTAFAGQQIAANF